MKKILTLLAVVLSLLPAFGQKAKKDIVYLKSGAVIRGQLVTYDVETVKINSGGNLFVYKIADVDSVSRHFKPIGETGLSKDYFFETSMGILKGNSGNSQTAPFSFMTSMNFRVTNKIYAGAGLGAEFLEETYMPVFAQFEYKMHDTKFTPFFNLQVGYEVALEDGNHQHYSNYYPSYLDYYPGPQTSDKLNAEGGFLINPSFGFQHFTSDNFGWFFSFGYRHHQLNYSGENNYKLESNFSRLSLKIGFIFN